MPPKPTKAEKAAAKKAAKEEKLRQKAELKAKKLQDKADAKAAKLQIKEDKKKAKEWGITYVEYKKRMDRKALVLKNKEAAAAKLAAEEAAGVSTKTDDDDDQESDEGQEDSEEESEEDEEESGPAVNLLDMGGEAEEPPAAAAAAAAAPTTKQEKKAAKAKAKLAKKAEKQKLKEAKALRKANKKKSKSKKGEEEQEEPPSTPKPPSALNNTDKHPHAFETPGGYIDSLKLNDAIALDTKDDLENDQKTKEEDANLTAEEVKERKRGTVLFGKKREIAPSPTRLMKNNEKKITDPLLTRRRKLIGHHSYVVDLKIKEKVQVLEKHIKQYEELLKEAPRDPIIEPKHRKAYQEKNRLAKELPPDHWGKLNSVGGRIIFYKIKLYLQRLTSLKLFPDNGECPFIDEERDQYDDRADWRCIHLNCSVNSLTKIKNIQQFIHLRCLDLSSNHIQTIGTTLTTLIELRELNLANNSIVRIEGLEKCSLLVRLNLHGNNIPKIENLNNFKNSSTSSNVLFQHLTQIDLGGNHLTRVENLHYLPSLTELDLSRNDLINAEELTFVPKLIVLNIGTKKLHNLVEFGRSLVGLHRLKELKVFGNPICDKRDYRLRVLENTSIKYLDDVEIKPRLRTYLKEMQKRAKLEDIMETTTQDYMDRIAAERQIKSDNMDLLRRSELELEDAFSKYRNEMENELQECISYIHSLDVREDLVERGTLSTVRGMDQWKEKLLAAQLKRDRAKRAYVRKQQAAMLQQTAHTSEALKYTEKLKELADARPGIWREMKRKELMQRTVEQRVQYKEDQTISKRRKKYQSDQKEIREDRERTMLEAVDQIDPTVEAWWNPDAETRDVTVEHIRRHDATHRDDIQRKGSSVVDGRDATQKAGSDTSDDTMSINSEASSRSMGSKNSKNSSKQKLSVQKRVGTKMITDDETPSNTSKSLKKSNLKNRYRVKFGPGSMGIKLVDRPEDNETGVYVKGLVEGGKGAMTHKIKVGDLLIRVQDESVTHMTCKQVLASIKVATRPIQLEFEHVVKKKAAAASMVAGAVHGSVFSTLFEKGKIGIVWEEETRPDTGGAIVKEVRDGSQAANHKPPVKVGDILVTIASEDITPLNLAAINKRILKARRPVRFDFESGEGADLLASAFDDEESSDEEDSGGVAAGGAGGAGEKKKDNVHKIMKTDQKVKKAGGLFGWGRKSKKVAPEK